MSLTWRMEHKCLPEAEKSKEIESPLEPLESNVANTLRLVRSLLDFYIAFKRTNFVRSIGNG